jgi:hypothetical protein
MKPTAVHSIHEYEVRPRKDKHGVDVISKVSPIRAAVVWRTKCHRERNRLRDALQPIT